MIRSISGYWLLVPLLLVAIVIRNWVESPETLLPETPLAMQEAAADYWLEDFTTRRFDVRGDLEYLLTGDTLSHYPADDPEGEHAEIVSPSLRLRDAEAEWSMTAGTGRLTRRPDVVTLADDVVLTRTIRDTAADAGLDRDDAASALIVRAEALSIALDTRDVFTDTAVTLEGPGMRIRAVGLQSSVAAGKLELVSRVTGRYDVASDAPTQD